MNLNEMGDAAIIKELGIRFQRERLNKNISQADVAQKAGVSRRSIQNFELGRPCTTTLLVRVLRALGKLEAIESFLPEPGPSPLQLAKLKGHERLRAGTPRHKSRKRN
jgi:putative transcriptional regulator